MKIIATFSCALLAHCDAPPPCVDSVTLHSPCGITDVATTCTGTTTSDCSTGSCTVGPIASDCAIIVTLGDTTKHVVQVVTKSESSCGGTIITMPFGGSVGFASSTCPMSSD